MSDLRNRRVDDDPINPSHYKGDYVMRIIEDFNLDFLKGTILKYLLRAGVKSNRTELEDLRKARWYLDRLIANLAHSSSHTSPAQVVSPETPADPAQIDS